MSMSYACIRVSLSFFWWRREISENNRKLKEEQARELEASLAADQMVRDNSFGLLQGGLIFISYRDGIIKINKNITFY